MSSQRIIVGPSVGKKRKLNRSLILLILMIFCQAWGGSLPEKPVISYYFPRATGEYDTTDTLSVSNIVDAKQTAWTSSLRDYWRDQGKLILKREDFDYTATYTQNELNTVFETNLSLYDGLSIDELVAHQMDSSRISVFLNALDYIRSTYPDKLIIVYSATSWDADNPLLVACMEGVEASADLLVPEIYLIESYGLSHNWVYPYLRTRISALSACGSANILGMTSIILGINSTYKDRTDINFADHIRAQLQYIKNDNLLSQTRGIAFYAPLYASPDELKSINKAVMDNTLCQLYLRFDEASGSIAEDCSGFGNDGTVYAAWTDGKSGNALEFDGVNDYVSCGSDSSLELKEFTYCAWIKPATISPQYQQIIGKSSIWNKGFFVSYGHLRGCVAQSSTNATAVKYNTVTANTWQHVAMTYANNEVKLYLNGTLLATANTTGAGDIVSTSESSLLISSQSYPFNGLMDDVRVYSRALSANDINNIYRDAPLQLRFRLDEPSDSLTAIDFSGLGNNGALTNFSTSTCWVSGKSGNALEFDGSDSYVNCGNKSSVELKEFTYTAWVMPHTVSSQYQQIIGKNSIWHKGFFISYGDLRGRVGQSNSAATAIKYNAIIANTWQHVAMTYANNEIKLYLNGQLLSATTTLGSGTVTSTSSYNLLLSSSSCPFDGLMDDVRIYPRALNETEIGKIYQEY